MGSEYRRSGCVRMLLQSSFSHHPRCLAFILDNHVRCMPQYLRWSPWNVQPWRNYKRTQVYWFWRKFWCVWHALCCFWSPNNPPLYTLSRYGYVQQNVQLLSWKVQTFILVKTSQFFSTHSITCSTALERLSVRYSAEVDQCVQRDQSIPVYRIWCPHMKGNMLFEYHDKINIHKIIKIV